MRRLQFGSVGECDGDGMLGNPLVDDWRAVENEVAGGSGIRHSPFDRSRNILFVEAVWVYRLLVRDAHAWLFFHMG